MLLSLALAWSACAHADGDGGLVLDVNGAVAGVNMAVGTEFEDGSVQLNDDGKAKLALFLQRANLGPSERLTVTGFADEAAAAANDKRQSFGRALEVKASLLMLGFAADSIGPVTGSADPGSQEAPEVGDAGLVEVRVVGRTVAAPAADAAAARASSSAMASGVTAAAAASPGTAAGVSAAAAAAPDAQAPARFALGLGYPDLRARLTLGTSWDLEAKVAVEQGIQVYTGRIYWNPFSVGPIKALLGVEGGYGMFQGVDDLNGDALILGGFVGLEYPFSRRLGVSFDVGPACIQAQSEGISVTSYELVYNTALYIYLF